MASCKAIQQHHKVNLVLSNKRLLQDFPLNHTLLAVLFQALCHALSQGETPGQSREEALPAARCFLLNPTRREQDLHFNSASYFWVRLKSLPADHTQHVIALLLFACQSSRLHEACAAVS